MNRRVAACGPAAAQPQKTRVVHFADQQCSGVGRYLGMALEAEVGVALNQQSAVHRPMRLVTCRTTFAQCLVLEYERPGLFPVAPGTRLIEPGHRQAPRWFHQIAAMRIMALHTVHLALDHGVPLGQTEFGMDLKVALEAWSRIQSGIVNEFVPSAASVYMQAACAVARLTSRFACHSQIVIPVITAVGAGRETAHQIRVTIHAYLIPHERCPLDVRW